MNFPAPASRSSSGVHPASGYTAAKSAFDVRIADIAALNEDGSKVIGQRRIPAIPGFDDAIAAFAQGSVFKAADGYIAVEDLQPGDHLTSPSGESEPVAWVGSALYAPDELRERVRLTRITADSFGQNRPGNMTTFGPAARILKAPPDLRGATFGDRLVTPASRFLDGVSVIEVTPPTPVRLFHIAMRRHMSLMCNGLPVESFHPGHNSISQMSETLRNAFLSMFPHIADLSMFGAMAFARAPESQSDFS